MAGHTPATLTGGNMRIQGKTKKNIQSYWKAVQGDLNRQVRMLKKKPGPAQRTLSLVPKRSRLV